MALNRFGGSQGTKKPMPLLVKLIILIAILAIAGIGLYYLVKNLWSELPAGPTQVDLKALWSDGSYDEILAITNFDLQSDPMNPVNLVFSGFSTFHLGLAQVSVEDKLKFMDDSVRLLRKALLIPNTPLKPQIHYILAKAYLYKGKYYSDLSISHMNKSLEMGYTSDDSYEYLGLAYSQLGKYTKSNEFFLKALEINQSDLLLWTLGQTNFQMQNYPETIKFLTQVIAKTQDRSLELKSRFLLGEVYTRNQDYNSAENEYNAILEKNASSADANYYLGEIYLAQGNKEKARAYWRRAFNIDPLHYNANQRLFRKQ
ncbi:MAG: hypothetical protein A2Z96_06285 [Spirochaetes bacterium GWB1_48_6]|nr:MAG: hypothetical protein A2Z96_06285 [Spirochaetes bacterium GWB1_48_6]